MAGTPATMVAGGTSRVTTAPAATMALSPMVTPARTVALEPIQTRLPMTMGAGCMDDRRRGAMSWFSVARTTLWPMRASSPDVDAALVLEPAAGVEKDPLAQGDVLAAVGAERGKEREGLVHRLADELGKELADLLGRVVAGVELAGDGQGLLAELVHELVGW